MAEKCESGSVYFSSTVTINGCTIKGVALEQNHEPTHRIHITLPWGEEKRYVGMTPGSCSFYYTNGHAILCKVCLEKVEGYTCYYKVCRTIEKCDQQFAVVDDDTGKYIPGATVKVGGVKCEHEYPSLERYQKDNLTEGSWYNVVATKTGYTCPSDICKNTFEACGDAVVLKLKAEYHPTVCSDYTDALTCAANNCYWWSDGKCHDTEEPSEGEPYKKWNCKTLREFDRSDKHITEVECYCPSGESKITQVVDYDWSWIETVMSRHCPSVKKDTVICDFNIYDAADKKVTDLVAGTGYWIKAYLCETCKIGFLKGCASGKKVSGETLKLFLSGQAAEVAKGTTNVDGYTAFYWTPSELLVPKVDIRLEFKGSANYNASESTKTVKVEKKEKYTINIIVKDQDGKPLAGAYVDIDKYVAGVWREVSCSETVITKGTCSTDAFAGDKDNIKTDYNGKVSFTLPFLPGGIPNKYGFRVGKVGYLNKKWHEDWTDRKETEPQPAPQGGTYDFVFSLTDATIANKFIVHTVGFKEGDKVSCVEAYDWSKCFVFKPTGVKVTKTPSSYPDDTVEFTEADGFKPGMTCGIGPIINIAWKWDFAMGPTWCGEFKGLKEPVISRYGPAGIVCDFFGIDPASDECRRFWAEFIDPVYVANIITGLTKGTDVYGSPYNPSGFEIAMFPVVLVCSTMPFIPGAKISKFIGKALRIGKKTTKVAGYLDADAANIYRATMFGDEARLSKWRKAIEAEDVTEARRITNDIVLNPSISNAEAVKRVKLGLDELDKTINAKIKVGANANDLRRRMVIVADAYMDPELYIKSMDDAYVEYISIMQRGTRDKATDVFVRAAADARAKLPWKCKYNVLNATGKLKIGTETLDLLEITKILKKNVKETDVLYKKAFRGLADLKEGDIRGLNFLIDSGAEKRVVMELRTHANKVPDKKSFEWLHKQNAWALDKWGTKWLGVKHHSGFAVDYWRSIWAGIRNHTPWLKKVDDIGDVMSDAELQKLWSTEVVNDIAIELDKKGRYADASEILRYSVDDPSYFKGGYSNALMDTFVHSDQPSFIAEHIKPLTHAQAAERRAWFHNLKPILKKKLGDVDGERVFKKLGLESLEETSNLNKAFFAYGKSSYDNMVEQAIRGGANRADAEKLATVGLRTQTDFIKAVNMGEITSRKGLFAFARRHKVISGLGSCRVGNGALVVCGQRDIFSVSWETCGFHRAVVGRTMGCRSCIQEECVFFAKRPSVCGSISNTVCQRTDKNGYTIKRRKTNTRRQNRIRKILFVRYVWFPYRRS